MMGIPQEHPMSTETLPAPQEPEQQEPLAATLTIPQVAKVLACSPDSVSTLIKRGHLHAVKIGRLVRIPAHSVQSLLK
jgi:excisionase family DNA binding protein